MKKEARLYNVGKTVSSTNGAEKTRQPYTVKGFGIVNKAEVDVFLELSCFFHDPAMLAI